MNWINFVVKLPVIIHGAVDIVHHIKGAAGSTKKQAVLDSIGTSVALVEFAAGKDLLNDPVIAELVSVYIDAEATAMKAKRALQSGILAKQPKG